MHLNSSVISNPTSDKSSPNAMYNDNNTMFLYLLMMPRVVNNQKNRFDTDELFLKHAQTSTVKYTGHLGLNHNDRRQKLIEDCANGKIDIVYSSTGFNLELSFRSSDDTLDFSSDPSKVAILSHLIINGVCVRWRGFLDRTSLTGQGQLEFDEAHAQVEIELLENRVQNLEQGNRTHSHFANALPTAQDFLPSVSLHQQDHQSQLIQFQDPVCQSTSGISTESSVISATSSCIVARDAPKASSL